MQPSKEDEAVFRKIVKYFDDNKIAHKVLTHESAKSSEESAKLRDTPLDWGAKTMLIRKDNAELIMLIYPANLKLSWSKVKKIPAIGKKFERADQDMYQVLGVKQGGIPPFPWLFGIKGFIDQQIKNKEQIAFNAGLTTKSIVMAAKDLPLENTVTADLCET